MTTTHASRDLLIALALIAVVAGACNEDAASPVAPSVVSAPDTAASYAPAGSALGTQAASVCQPSAPDVRGEGCVLGFPPAYPEPSFAAMDAGTCTAGSGYIRCWHFRPTLVLWVSPNATWARGGTPFVSHLRSGFKVHCDKTIVWSGGRRIYRVSPMRPVTIDGERYTCS